CRHRFYRERFYKSAQVALCPDGAIVLCARLRGTGSTWARPVMKSLRIIVRRHGGPEGLETVEEEAPEPGRGEARGRGRGGGVSFAEMLMREGLHPEKTILPFTPGWDIVGVVEKVGEETSQAWIGQVVAALPIHGGYTQHICLPQTELTPVPNGLDP